MIKIRCEADLYGYSKLLSNYLGYQFAPNSLRGFQHGWIWWNPNDLDPAPGCGLDPNLSEYWGVLVQDDAVANSLLKKGIFAVPSGLPFINWLRHINGDVALSDKKENEILFVPGHSNPWNNISNDVMVRAVDFSKRYSRRCQILLGGSDFHLAKELSNYYSKVHIGATVSDANSFVRLHTAFNECSHMVTDSLGSHICYALHCGMKVGLHADFYKPPTHYGPETKLTSDYKKLEDSGNLAAFIHVSSITYVEKRFQGMIISDASWPAYGKAPYISDNTPAEIAQLLGWDITYACELPKRSFNK